MQDYGQGPQAYGQPQQGYNAGDQKPLKGDHATDDEWENMDYWRCGNSKSQWAKIDNWCVMLSALGCFMCMVASFIPSWRYDPHGTTDLEKYFSYNGFESRGYGIVHIKGSYSSTWITAAQAACDIRNIGQLSGIGEKIIKTIKSESCEGSENCQGGFNANMHVRCENYSTMMRISMVTLIGTFIGVVSVVAGTLLTSLSKRKKHGGILFGMNMFAVVLFSSTSIAWALVTDSSFKNIANTAWFPYPSLSFGFYVHTAGYLTIFVSTALYGRIILPMVWAYDPAQEKLNKKKKKIEKAEARQKQIEAKKAKLNAIAQGGGQPGYGQQPMMQAPGYGQAYPQQQYGSQPGSGQPWSGGGNPQAGGDFGMGGQYGVNPIAPIGLFSDVPVVQPMGVDIIRGPSSDLPMPSLPAQGVGFGGPVPAQGPAGNFGIDAQPGSYDSGVSPPQQQPPLQQPPQQPPARGFNWPAYAGPA